jgi:3-oxoacyl-[acyl-carrier protein] reductase
VIRRGRRPRQPVAVVSGASRGLGRAIAVQLGSAGYRVVIHYHTARAAAARVRRTIERAGGTAFIAPADLRDRRAVDRLVSQTLQTWDRIDLLVHGAGVVHDGLLIRMAPGDWHEVIATHLTGGFHLLQRIGRVMVEQRNGHIMTIGSIAGLMGRAGQANYAAAKAGLVALTTVAAREWGPYNIRVNCVLPGYLPAGMGRRLHPPQRRRLMQEALLKRGSTVEEVAGWIVALSTTQHVSGQLFNLDSRLI